VYVPANVWFTGALLIELKSSIPFLIFPSPSAKKLPPTTTAPPELNPLNANAKFPLSRPRLDVLWIANVNCAVKETGGVSLSVTVTPKVAPDTAVVGVPESSPELASVRPAGKVEPLTADHVYGAVPPEAANCSLYAVPTVPLGRGEVVVMIRFVTVIVSPDDVAEAPVESVTLIVTGDVP
jgi:hypothetical protein